jgi:hypothetical protein
MKRFTLILMTMFCFAFVINAQNHVNTLNRGWAYGIPGCFTNNGHSNVVCVQNGDFYIYDNDFSTVLINSTDFSFIDEPIKFYYVDFSSADYWSSEFDPYKCEKYLMFTQSLFNSDDNYEYVTYFDSGWNIVSTDGTIFYTINTDDGFEPYWNSFVIKMDNNYFLGLIEIQQGGSISSGKMLIYRIDQTTGLTKVDTQLPISVFPTLADRSQQITVELGEGNNAKEITVVNSLGQVVKRVPVEEGQHEITIPASDLGTGLNVVNTRSEQGQGSCKIIVR